MKYKIALTTNMAKELKEHILSDRSKEQMAITLCGVNHLKDETRLLARHLILLPPEAFSRQSCAYLEIRPEVQRKILQLADAERLSQVDWHSHPGESEFIGFSGVDDHHEKRLAVYLKEKIPGTFYASVVMNQKAFDARIWETNGRGVSARSIDSLRWDDFNGDGPGFVRGETRSKRETAVDERFSRQVLAFGSALQERLRQYRMGIIGVGGLGGIIVEMLTRLGASDWILVDDDVVEETNLNRLPGSTQRDAYQRTRKVGLAQRNISRFNPFARVCALPFPVSDPKVIQTLKSCDLLIVATDNHSSRLIANRLSVQYLIPLIHVGVNIDVDEDRKISDISGEYAIPSLGQWCLHCGGIIDPQMAGWELASKELRETLHQRGYIKDTPAPAVYHLNGVMASLAVAEIHNLIFPYKTPQRYLAYDELKGELLSLGVREKDDCLVCRAEGGLLGLGDLEPFPDFEGEERTIPSSDQFGADDRENPENAFQTEPGESAFPMDSLSEEIAHDRQNV